MRLSLVRRAPQHRSHLALQHQPASAPLAETRRRAPANGSCSCQSPTCLQRCQGRNAGGGLRRGRVDEMATRLSGALFFRDLPLRRSGYPACGGGLVRRTVQDDEVSNLPSKGRLLASVSLSVVSVLNWLEGRSSVSLSPVPRDDNGKLRGLSRESVEPSQRSATNDDTDGLS